MLLLNTSTSQVAASAMAKEDVRYRGASKPPRGALCSDHYEGKQGAHSQNKAFMYLAILAVSVVGVLFSYISYQRYLQEIVRSPLNYPKIIGENSSMPSENPERFWGTYRYGACIVNI